MLIYILFTWQLN